MLGVTISSVICELKMVIVEPLDLDIIHRTRAAMPENRGVPTTAGGFQSDLCIVAAKEPRVVE